MKKAALYATAAVLIGHTALAADKNVDQMQQLYSKIRNIVNITNNEVRPGGTFFVMLSPGIILDPALHPETDNDDRRILDTLIDRTMEPGWIYRPYEATASDIYARVLYNHAAPVFKLPAETQAELDALNAKFYQVKDGKNERTARFEQYLDYLNKYTTAIDNTRTWFNSHPGKLPSATLVNAEQNARDEFYTLGEGGKLSADLQRLREIGSYDPNTWWAQQIDIYQALTEGVIPAKRFPVNLYYPKYQTWLDKSIGWTGISLSQSDLERTTSDGSTSTGGGLGVSWGMFSINASGSGGNSWKNVDVTYSGMKLDFEVTRVNIYRPWMNTGVFYSDAWCWNTSAPDLTPVSSGGAPSKGQQLNGLMPFLATGILLARNVKVTANWSRDINNEFNSTVAGGGGISFGPFSFGGSHSETHHDTYTHGSASGSGLEFKDPQILGYFVEVLPQAPNPNPNLKFTGCKPASTTADASHSPGLSPVAAISAQLKPIDDIKRELQVDQLVIQQSRLPFLFLQNGPGNAATK